MCFDGYKVSGTPILELYLPTLISSHDTNQDNDFCYMQRNCSCFCVLSVCSLPASDTPVYVSVLLEKFTRD